MATKQLQVRHMDLQDGDVIVRTHGGGQFLVEREVSDEYPPNTVYVLANGEVYIRSDEKDRWNDRNGMKCHAISDERVREWLDRFSSDKIVYTPDTKGA